MIKTIPPEEERVSVESVFSIFNKNVVSSIWKIVEPLSTMSQMVRLGKRAQSAEYQSVIQKAFTLGLTEADVTNDQTDVLKALWASLNPQVSAERRLDAMNFMTMASCFLSTPWIEAVSSSGNAPAASTSQSSGKKPATKPNSPQPAPLNRGSSMGPQGMLPDVTPIPESLDESTSHKPFTPKVSSAPNPPIALSDQNQPTEEKEQEAPVAPPKGGCCEIM